MLLLQLIRRAASRAACTAGRSSETKTPIIAITTSNSTSVKPARGEGRRNSGTEFPPRDPKQEHWQSDANGKRVAISTMGTPHQEFAEWPVIVRDSCCT